MIRTVISHDATTGKARIKFEHNGVTVEQDYNLIDVIPSTRYVFAAMGLEFDESYQALAMDRLEATIQNQIEEGAIQNPPEPQAAAYSPPPSSDEETEVDE